MNVSGNDNTASLLAGASGGFEMTNLSLDESRPVEVIIGSVDNKDEDVTA